MAQPTILVKDANSSNQTVNTINNNGQTTAANSQPVVLASDQVSSIAQGTQQALLVGAGPVNFVVSTANSYTGTVAVGTPWTGTIETILSAPEAAILLRSDQNGTLTLNQYIDAGGTQPSLVTTYNITAGVPYSATIAISGNYVNLSFTNLGGVTANIVLDTQYGTMPTAGRQVSAASAPVVIASDDPIMTAISANTAALVDEFGSGNITTQNLNPNTGVATAGSTVLANQLNAAGTLGIQVQGTYTGQLTVQGTIDNVNWVAIAAVTNLTTGVTTSAIPSGGTGVFQTSVSGMQYVRVTATGPITGTATVNIRITLGSDLVAIDSPLPAGSNSIGTVGVTSILAPQTTMNIFNCGTGNSNSVVAQVTPGGIYTLTVSQPYWSWAYSTNNTSASVVHYQGMTMLYMTTVNNVFVGQMVSAVAGVQVGTYVTAVDPVGLTITLSRPLVGPAAIAASTAIYTTGGFFQTNFEWSPDNVNWNALTVSSKSTIGYGTMTMTNHLGLYTAVAPTNASYIRARLASTSNNLNGVVVGTIAASGNALTTALSGTPTVAQNHTLVVGQMVNMSSVTGLTGVTAGVNYYVQSIPTASTFTLSATIGGPQLTITGTPSAGLTMGNQGPGFTLSATVIAANIMTTSVAHSFQIGQQVNFANVTGITGLTANTPYYVCAIPSTTTFGVSATRFGQILTISGTPATSAIGCETPVQMYITTYAQNKAVPMPYFTALTPQLPAVSMPWTFVDPTDVSDVAEIDVDVIGLSGTSQTLTWLQSSDPNLYGTLSALPHSVASSSSTAGSLSATAVGNFRITPRATYFLAKLTGTAFTAVLVSGVTAHIGAPAAVEPSPTINLGYVAGSAVSSTTAQLGTNTVNIGGTAVVTAGVAGMQAVGGNIAAGTAATANPLLAGAVDNSNLTRKLLSDTLGELATFGSGESVVPFTVGTGAAAVTDGTNGKSIFLPPREHDIYLNITAISTSPTMQIEGSHDGVLFSIIPLSRIDNTASSQQYSAQAAFTPAVGNIYKGRSYGFPIIRVHLTAGTTSNTVGVLRAVPVEQQQGVTVSHFGINATSTTESVGIANGQVQAGGVRTLKVPSPGSCKALLQIDYGVGSATTTIQLESSNDGVNYSSTGLPLQPIAGGATVTSFNITGTAALPQQFLYETDVSAFKYVRVHCTAASSAVVLGSLKLIPWAASEGLQNSQKPTYMVTTPGLAPTASTNISVIESGSAKVTTIKRLIIQPGFATANGIATLTLNRNTVAATASGTQPTAATLQRNTNDAAFSGIVRTGAFTVSGVTTTASQVVIPIPTPISTTTSVQPNIIVDLTNGGTEKGFEIPVGVTNGAMFTHSGLSGATGFSLSVEWTEE
jgi:hypothetical protein